MYYRVGIATDPQPEDPYCDTQQEAIEKAKRRADCDFRLPVAVWEGERGEIVWLFLMGEQFRRA